jgi:hypothetical protein
MSVDERPGASDSPTPATYALGRDTAEAERLRRQTTELQPLAAELLDRVGAGGRYAADGDGPDSAELGAISASTLAVCPPRRRPSPLHYRRVDGAGTPTLPVDYLGPCDADLLKMALFRQLLSADFRRAREELKAHPHHAAPQCGNAFSLAAVSSGGLRRG